MIKASFEDNIDKLASGKRITSAKDDAAGLQISNRLTTQLLVKQQNIRNLNDGISYGQTADAALAETTNILQRIRTLALQAANGSNTAIDRLALDEEIQVLKQALDFSANNTQIFGKYPLLKAASNLKNVPLLDQSFTNGVTQNMPSGWVTVAVIPPGTDNLRIWIDSFGANDDIQLFDLNGNHIVGSMASIPSAGAVEGNLFTPANGFNGTETYDNSQLFDGGGYNYPATNTDTRNGMTFTFSGNNNPANNNEELIINRVTEPLLLAVTGNGAFNINASWTALGTLDDPKIPPDNQMLVTAKDLAVGADGYIDFPEINATADGLGVGTSGVSSIAQAQSTITEIDSALAKVGAHRAEIGAKINAAQSVIRNIQNQEVSLTESRQRIQDSDYALELAKKVKNDILTESTTVLMNQAVTSKSTLLTSMLSNIGP